MPKLADLGLELDLPAPLPPGEDAGRARMEEFLAGLIDDYRERHDHLAGGSSVLSPYLRFGCVSPRELEQRVHDHRPARPTADRIVLELLDSKPLRRGDILETREGVCRVGPPLAREVAAYASVLHRAVAPHAELLAQQLRKALHHPTPITRTRHRAAARADLTCQFAAAGLSAESLVYVALADLTSRAAVLEAMQRFDEMGRDAFLATHGFGPLRAVVAVHEHGDEPFTEVDGEDDRRCWIAASPKPLEQRSEVVAAPQFSKPVNTLSTPDPRSPNAPHAPRTSPPARGPTSVRVVSRWPARAATAACGDIRTF